jgi:serine/threonine-protein kinase
MADVHRAFDPTLNRNVALKFLREIDDEQVERFLREARTQARVGHENICDVYEAGVSGDGRPFIAMRWIDGVTLADAAPKMSIDEKVAVMAGVAEAVHAAHRVGLVHRDLKPNNIMVESTPEGWHPYVLDFGLARDASMDTMTHAGAVMGTPPFMAPEQARGDRASIDRRTDVYSLGATLFDILTGRPPFESESSVGVMVKVVSEEAPSLRTIDPTLPIDLDTIVLQCLEKDPRRRYDSARALADDLRRYLNGDAVHARPVTFLYRWTTRARKHPIVASLLGVAVIAVLASIALTAITSMRAAEKQRAAQRFGQEIERIEAVARYSNMLPLHDVQRERRWIRARIAQIAREQKTLGSTAAGPAQYAIGRGYLALHEWARSRSHLEAAWQDNYRAPEVAYALGRVIGAQYEEELSEADRVTNADTRAARRRQVERKYRDAALTWLRRSAGSGSESPAYAEGRIALYEKRYDAALQNARAAFQAVPWLHEAKKLEGDIWLARGNEQYNDGKMDDAVASYQRAGQAYRAASAIAASDESALIGEAEMWFRLMQVSINRGEEPVELLRRGLAASERAATTNANVAGALQQQGTLLLRYGEWQLSQSASPLATLDRAIAIGRRAVTIDPSAAASHRIIGAALFSKARYAATHGQDPLPLFDESIRSLRQAVSLDPRGAYTLMALANSIRRKGETIGGMGQNPLPLLNESVVYYERATAADPEWANSWNDRGLATMTRGEWEMEHGVDPMASFADSAKSLERAVQLNPKLSVSMLNLGSMHLDRGNALLRRGGDPRPALQQATDAYAAALQLNPKLAYAHANSGLADLLAAQYALDAGEDPRRWIDRGLASYAKALEIQPDHANSFAYGGALLLVDAQHALRNGGDPTALLDQARARIRHAEEIDQGTSDYLQFAAAVEAEAARYALERKKSAAAPLAAAERFVKSAIAVNAEDADTFYTAADVARLSGDDERALQAVERSIAIDGEKSESHALRGELLLARAKRTHDRRDAAAAMTELDRAMQLKPSAAPRLRVLREEAIHLTR